MTTFKADFEKVEMRSRRQALFALALIGAFFAALALKTWRRWPDLVVDFGAQLYMPWQISTGAVLYRDMAYLAGGPLSQHYHALLFKIFGVSFLTVVISNLAVLAVLLMVMYRRFYRSADQLTAVMICGAVLAVFAFAQYTLMGIFNYITPYSAEAVHGLVLSVLAVALLARWIETEQARLAAAAGLCGGLTLLTKPDMCLALALTFLASGAIFWQAKRNGKLLGRSLALMAGAGLIPLAGFFFWFFRVENFQQSLRSVFAAWIPLLTTRAADNPFYRWCLGLDRPLVHLRQSAAQFLVLAGVVCVCALVCLREIPGLAGLMGRQRHLRLAYQWCLRKIPGLLGLILPMAAGAVLIKASWDFNWFECGRCLPLVCLTLLVLLLWRAPAARADPAWVFAILWTVWSLVLLAKLGLFWRIWHYGFVLAMPAFVSGVYLLLWALPQQLEGCGVRPVHFRTLLALMLLAGLTRITQASLALCADKSLPIGSGADTMLAYDPHFNGRDAEIAAALQWIEENVPARATLTVLPQGAMLNYLSRHANPCGYGAWNPPEMAAFGQEKMTAAFIQRSPDYVVLIFVNYGEYGETIFGADKRFGGGVMEWIDAHYQPVLRIGHDWLKDGQFGIKILKKNPD